MGILIDILVLLAFCVLIRRRKWRLFGKEIPVSAIVGSHFLDARNVALVVIITALVWSLTASWYTAHLIIDYDLEMDGYFLCFVMVFCGAFLYALATPQPCSRLKSSVVVFGWIFSMIFVLSSCGHSDHTFMYWKMRQIRSQSWQQMVSDLKDLGKSIPEFGPDGNHPTVDSGRLPKSLDDLGMHSDYDFFYSGPEPCIIYGSQGAQGRQWGLIISSKHLFYQELREGVKWIRVTEDACFFVDPN